MDGAQVGMAEWTSLCHPRQLYCRSQTSVQSYLFMVRTTSSLSKTAKAGINPQG